MESPTPLLYRNADTTDARGRVTLSIRASMLFLVVLFAACGSDPPGSPSPNSDNEVSGQYKGFAMDVADAGFVGGDEFMVILLSDFKDVCGAVARGSINLGLFELYQNVPNSKVLSWTVFGRGPDGTPGTIEPGPIAMGFPCFEGSCPGLSVPPDRDWGFPLMARANARCTPQVLTVDLSSPTLTGKLNLTSLSRGGDGHVAGTFEILDREGGLRGRFRARRCTLIGPDPEAPGC